MSEQAFWFCFIGFVNRESVWLIFLLSSLVFVSTPKISVVGRAILGQPVKILCQSDIGSLPINYTLFKDFVEVSTISINQSSQQAHFQVNITSPEDIKQYICEASNNHRHNKQPLSEKLNAIVIGKFSFSSMLIHIMWLVYFVCCLINTVQSHMINQWITTCKQFWLAHCGFRKEHLYEKKQLLRNEFHLKVHVVALLAFQSCHTTCSADEVCLVRFLFLWANNLSSISKSRLSIWNRSSIIDNVVLLNEYIKQKSFAIILVQAHQKKYNINYIFGNTRSYLLIESNMQR